MRWVKSVSRRGAGGACRGRTLRLGPMRVQEALGAVGMPAPARELARRRWDAIVVGGGHNGLTAAAYLARAGRSVLVLERRERLGGACTLEQPFSDPRYLVSPCAYVVGLLDERVVRELELARRGYRVLLADPNLWCPLPDGRSVALDVERERTLAALREQGFGRSDVEGYAAYEDAFERLRRLLRAGPLGDAWEGSSPSREELEAAIGDEELIAIAFEDSIAGVLDRYIGDEALKHALFGQGVIGAFAGPREAGAALACGAPVARIVPGEGVELESGDRIHAPVVVANADPKRVLAMLEGAEVPGEFRRRLEAWRVDSAVVKLNAALARLPAFTAAGGEQAHRAMVGVSPGLDAAQGAAEAARRGEAAIGYAELYFQTGYDPSVAPPG